MFFGFVIDNITPGKPPPEPMSKMVLFSRMFLHKDRHSKTSFSYTSSLVFLEKMLCVLLNSNAASTKPFGFVPYYPGPGLGGHCIPIVAFYFTWNAREFGMHTRFIELAWEINSSMPDYVVIQTTGNAVDFGSLATSGRNMSAPSSGTRGLFSGAYGNPTHSNIIEYITIAVPSNGTDFGDMTTARSRTADASNDIRGIVAAGNPYSNVIDLSLIHI